MPEDTGELRPDQRPLRALQVSCTFILDFQNNCLGASHPWQQTKSQYRPPPANEEQNHSNSTVFSKNKACTYSVPNSDEGGRQNNIVSLPVSPTTGQ